MSYRAPAIYEVPLVVAHGGRDRGQSFRQVSAAYVWRAGAPPPDRLSHPVTLVRWQDAVAYCEWLAAQVNVPVRLPAEAEWEKAARGGFEGRRYPCGDEVDPSQANFLPDPSLKRFHATKPVGSYPPNPYGLLRHGRQRLGVGSRTGTTPATTPRRHDATHRDRPKAGSASFVAAHGWTPTWGSYAAAIGTKSPTVSFPPR